MLRSLIPGFLCCLLLAPVGVMPMGMAHADEFTTVPPGDALYGHLASITKAGWIGDAPTQGTSHSLTRYEVALETAKAIFTVTARHRADPNWAATAPKTALRALRDLTVALSPELKQLDIDINATRALFDSLIKAPLTGTALTNPLPSRNTNGTTRPSHADPFAASTTGGHRANASIRPQGMKVTSLVTGGLSTTDQAWSLPLSQRLRVNTAIQALAQEQDDPLQTSTLTGHRSSFVSPHAASSNSVTGRSLGTNLDVNRWLSINAGYHQQTLVPRPYSLREALFAASTQTQSIGGGVDIRLLHSLTLSGNMAKVVGTGGTTVRGTRYGGSLGLTGWQNRLSLSANLSRLVPEDSLALTSTAAELNVGLDVTQRLSLNLLYQQMFGIQNQTQVAGGIVINF